MLYRLALVQHGDKWVVQKVKYSRIQSDRRTTAVYVDTHLGPTFSNLRDATEHLATVYDYLKRIEFQDQVIADDREDAIVRAQSKTARDALWRGLVKLTGTV